MKLMGYEKCEGIKRAIQFVEGSTRQEVLQEIDKRQHKNIFMFKYITLIFLYK